MTMTAEQSRQTGGYYAQQWTVHDEYTMAAMQGLIIEGAAFDPEDRLSCEALVRDARRYADAMLAERRRGSGKELANDIAEVLSLPKRDDPPAHEGEL